ncbi:histidinol-phosphatase HisJ [Peribacillus cavernae]|uniref:Histidinol-phosphatase n=1 Tax=Peribacillus cavernae TaxID=1674310 RepID=A0A433HH40_9BACI|nr:histidinol-phosphatase HisJ [Peribacillus cavernae]MDQ0221087.1 histidinol-phosphatase (PHP family) [Peribacillus cavernae]RUQ27619.1 histidinol-phosphatase HisJ [Peribacillus cavernae]
MKYDGHVHSLFCPHGSPDLFEEYIGKAIELGIEEISFTEHAPLPDGFFDPTPEKDSGMDSDQLHAYIEQLHSLKTSYRSQIKINIGLEVDFIEGFEAQTKKFLDETGPLLDDSILSVHFIKEKDKWHCLDFSAEMFGEISRQIGSVEAVHERYYSTVKKSIHADLGDYKPVRIGHITLVHKFQKQFPISISFDERVIVLLDDIHRKNYALDYNGAGATKPLCGEPYPPERFIRHAVQLGIPLVYGSDAHQAKDLGQGYESLRHTHLLTSPMQNVYNNKS